MQRVLVVEDEATMRSILFRILSERGYEVAAADSGERGLEFAQEFLPDVVVMDQNLPGMSGQSATQKIIEIVPGVKVIMVTAFGEIEKAVNAIRRGAYDYLTKPFDNDEFLLRVQRACEARRLALEVLTLREALGERHSFDRILGMSESLRAALHLARRAAQTEISVLIEGESGTGKEPLARAIHHASSRCNGPFLPVNCAAVPTDIAESQFFGHEKGAFTDAKNTHIGLFEQANDGTLFLDEVAEMPLQLQAKLLRALEDGQITRLGARSAVRINSRVIAATNRVVDDAIRDGLLRQDLYHRLAVVVIHVPPLRERKEDISLLARHFLGNFNDESTTSPSEFSDDALAALEVYAWPGNIRELRNVVQGAAIMAEGEIIRCCDLPRKVRAASAGAPTASELNPSISVDEPTLAAATATLERKLIAQALATNNGNRTRSAKRLGINRKTLLSKIAQYGLE
ncbi:MAG: sigma-54 dependent transcriptional regulator [Gemmatimonadota bacterium]|nr:sigma-54 dependent transcriptional regulator [Gemmatimonadota bacterium]